ncbi:MAG: SPOR domain-containing protein, partial [Balneolaceae bacterium]
MMIKTVFPLLLILLFIGCSTTEEATEQDRSDPFFDVSDEVVDEFVEENLNEFERTLLASRSDLSDTYANLEHDMPEQYLRERVIEEQEVDEFAGYRVQILSTRDVVHADTTKDYFAAWSDTTITGYQAEAYVFFRQPYYRVRAGDFRDRETAIEFSRLLKSHYPEAWVVHDRIVPANV